MKSVKVFIEVFIVFLTFNAIFGDKLNILETNLLENGAAEQINEIYEATSDDDVQLWGAINSDSVLANLPLHVQRNDNVGTIAKWNITYNVPRTIDGIRLTSVNNTGDGEIIDGGIGFSFATFSLIGNSNYFYFIIELYENYTTSLLTTTTTTRIPDRIINEWGTINYASRIILPTRSYTVVANPGVIIQEDIKMDSSRIIDGIRLTSVANTVASGEILEGGIGFNFTTIRVIANGNYLECNFEFFENGNYTTTVPPSTTQPTTTQSSTQSTTQQSTQPTTQNPGQDVNEWGKTDEDTKLDEKRFSNYPQPGYTSDGNGTLSTSGIILGMRLKRLNNTDGLWELIDGGLNKSSVTFNFKGAGIGRPYDFNVEIFGNSAVTVKLSAFLVILSSILFILFK